MNEETKQMIEEVEAEPEAYQKIVNGWVESMWEQYVAFCKEEGYFPSAHDFKEFLIGR